MKTSNNVEPRGADLVLGDMESYRPWGMWGFSLVQWKSKKGESRGGMRHHLYLNDHSICSEAVMGKADRSCTESRFKGCSSGHG